METSWGDFRYATEEETRTFFSNLEYHGYCWDEDKGGIIEYLCMDDGYFGQCVPYNDETARLLRTAEDYNGKYKTW